MDALQKLVNSWKNYRIHCNYKNKIMKNILIVLISVLLLACQEMPKEIKETAPVIDKIVKADTIPAIAVDSSITLNYIMGRFDPVKHPDFVLVNPPYSDGNKRYLHKDTWSSFKKMYEAAKKDGITLTIRSATRNFEAQKGIWEAKWTGARKVEEGENLAETTPIPKERALKILKWSSMPGSSRHHWGTDIDINDFENSYFEKGQGLKEYNWLVANASKFGFCQPYTPKGPGGRPAGYNEEKWHWSYIPLAKPLSDQAQLRLKNEAIKGFKGAETAVSIDIKNKYVLGINKECL